MKTPKDRKEQYLAKLRDPRWQKKRLEIYQRDNFACRLCGATDRTLNLHHTAYLPGKEPWEAPDSALLTLCEPCHEIETDKRYESQRSLMLALGVRGYTSAEIDALGQIFADLPIVKQQRGNPSIPDFGMEIFDLDMALRYLFQRPRLLHQIVFLEMHNYPGADHVEVWDELKCECSKCLAAGGSE